MLQKISRRQFLKRVGTVCAAAIVAPAILVKTKPKIVRIIDENGLLSCKDTSGRWKHYYTIYDEFAKVDHIKWKRRQSGYIITPYEKTNKIR